MWCFFNQIFVPHENRSEIDEIYNKTNIMKLQKLCNKVRGFLERESLFSLSDFILIMQLSKSLIGCIFAHEICNQATTNHNHCTDLRHQRYSHKGKQLNKGSS